LTALLNNPPKAECGSPMSHRKVVIHLQGYTLSKIRRPHSEQWPPW